jgi:hypothetical protein
LIEVIGHQKHYLVSCKRTSQDIVHYLSSDS